MRMSGRVVERCSRHGHVRLPRLTDTEARYNAAIRQAEVTRALNACFKAVYGPRLAAMVSA